MGKCRLHRTHYTLPGAHVHSHTCLPTVHIPLKHQYSPLKIQAVTSQNTAFCHTLFSSSLSLRNNLSLLPHCVQPAPNQTYVCGPYIFSNTLNLHSPIRMTDPFLSDLVNVESTVKFSVVKGFIHSAWEYLTL
jgi:hypothetical protein